MSKDRLRVRLVGDHPHRGEHGYIRVKDGKITMERVGVLDMPMLRVILEGCQHGCNECFARNEDLMVCDVVPLGLITRKESK
jgi:hypothetical protein